MSFNVIEIFNAWVTSLNPTEIQKQLAEKRLKICMSCKMKKEIIHNKKWSAICGKCGCPIEKKIFTDQFGSCPLSLWNELEKEYIQFLKKKNKSII